MKRTTLFAAIISACYCTLVAVAAEQNVTLAVDNMSCATCVPIVKKSLARIPGVKQVEVSLDKHRATVVFDDTQTQLTDLVAATTNAGYPSHPVAQP